MKIAGLDIGFSNKRTNVFALLSGSDLRITKWDVAERNAGLRALDRVEMLAIDAPLVPQGTTDTAVRAVERNLSRGAFQKRCKPGMSHIRGTGQLLRRHGSEAAMHALESTRSASLTQYPSVYPAHNIVEAFPNAFLGVCIDDAAYLTMPKLRRGRKFDWLYDTWARDGKFAPALTSAGIAASLLSNFEEERDHERRAALVCLLTAAFTLGGHAVIVGDALGGWFFLPPIELWSSWARSEAERLSFFPEIDYGGSR